MNREMKVGRIIIREVPHPHGMSEVSIHHADEAHTLIHDFVWTPSDSTEQLVWSCLVAITAYMSTLLDVEGQLFSYAIDSKPDLTHS